MAVIGFGPVRSHGCVNLSRGDPRWLAGFAVLHLPDGGTWSAWASARSGAGRRPGRPDAR